MTRDPNLLMLACGIWLAALILIVFGIIVFKDWRSGLLLTR